MALEIRQNLKLSQQLVITPQLQQAIKLLQLSRMELLEVVREELTENPVLEEESEEIENIESEKKGEELQAEVDHSKNADSTNREEVLSEKEGEFKEPKDFDWEDYMNTYNTPERISSTNSNSGLEELPSFEATLSQKTSLYDHLVWQLHLSDLTEVEKQLGMLLVGSINDDGYLQDPLEEIVEKLSLPLEKGESTLAKIQSFDPPGVGARDLKECLLIQIRFFGHERQVLEHLVTHHIQDLEKKDYRRIAKEMKIPLEQVFELTKIIQEFEPKPGRAFSENAAEYITPDAYVYKIGGEWTVVLNEDGLPKLKVSPFYQRMMKKSDVKGDTKEYVQTKLRSAVWLIRSIHQRQRTLYKTVKAIVKFQQDFFEKGTVGLKPMILRDVAQEIEMHESTVSRVTTNKYVHTPHGIHELKFFFNNGLPSSEGGDSVASESIKDKIRQIVSQEDPKAPYSDQSIVGILKSNKIDIARRTVAKYREMLGILPSSKRKQFF